MSLSVKHAFTSAKSDGGDATLIQPSNWNAEHTLTAALNKVLGTDGASTTLQELPCTALGRSLLASADLAAVLSALGMGGFTSGDVKLTFKTAADTGWVMMDDGTIGDATSGASTRANADCASSFAVIWAIGSAAGITIQDSGGVASTYGANAAADFAAHKRLPLPKSLGRALAIAGAGSGLTSRTVGTTTGNETNTLTRANLPRVDMASDITLNQGANITHNVIGAQIQSGGGYNVATADVTVAHAYLNGDVPQTSFSNMQPSSFFNVMLKL